eukprot:1739797-Pleurochrysis_carterae.AAC.2
MKGAPARRRNISACQAQVVEAAEQNGRSGAAKWSRRRSKVVETAQQSGRGGAAKRSRRRSK